MTKPTGNLAILVQALTFRPVHSFTTIDQLRTELCDADGADAKQVGQ